MGPAPRAILRSPAGALHYGPAGGRPAPRLAPTDGGGRETRCLARCVGPAASSTQPVPAPAPIPAGPAQYEPIPAGQAQYEPIPAGPTQYEPIPAGPAQYELIPAGPTQHEPIPAGPAQYEPYEPYSNDRRVA